MEIHSLSVSLDGTDKTDAVNVHIDNKEKDMDVGMGIDGNGSVMVCNNHEERIYHLHKTKHGGYILKEGTLL